MSFLWHKSLVLQSVGQFHRAAFIYDFDTNVASVTDNFQLIFMRSRVNVGFIEISGQKSNAQASSFALNLLIYMKLLQHPSFLNITSTHGFHGFLYDLSCTRIEKNMKCVSINLSFGVR